jgi:hypothetical protein
MTRPEPCNATEERQRRRIEEEWDEAHSIPMLHS